MKPKNYFLFVFLLVYALPAPHWAKVPSLEGKEAFVPGEIIVRFKDDAAPETRTKVMAAVGVSRSLNHPSLFKIKLKAGGDVFTAVQQMKNDSAVLYAQPNYRYYALGGPCALPTDQFVSIYSTTESWPFLKIQMDKALTVFSNWPSCSTSPGPGSSSVTVAVLDSG